MICNVWYTVSVLICYFYILQLYVTMLCFCSSLHRLRVRLPAEAT